MSARRAIAALTLVAGAITLVAVATADPAPTPKPPRAAPPQRPPVVIVSADGAVAVVEAGGARRGVGRVEVPASGAIRGVTAKGGRVFLDVDVRTKGDLSFAGALVAVREGEPSVELARDVVHASTPAVLEDGRVVVSRGAPGAIQEGASRVDALRVDAIDPDTGALETLARYEGYVLFIAGVLGDELLLYRVGVDGADIAAVSVGDPAHPARVLAAVPPFARDFSVDHIDKRLVYVNRAEKSWALSLLDLQPGAPREAMTSASMRGDFMAMIPRALPFTDADGHAELLVTLDPRVGPTLRSALGSSGNALALGPGSAHVADADAETGWFTGTVGVEGTRAHVFVANVKTGDVEAWAVPELPTFVAGFARGER